MNRMHFKKSILCGIVVGSMISSMGIATSTKDFSQAGRGTNSYLVMEKQETIQRDRGLESILDELVQEKKISSQKAQAILDYRDEHKKETKGLWKKKEQSKHCRRGRGLSLLSQLEKEDIITEKEATLIKDKYKERHQKRLDAAFEQMVNEKILTEDQATAVEQRLKIAAEQRRADFEKTKDMTQEERKDFFKELKKSRKGPFEQMIEDGIITEEQRKEIKRVIKRHYKSKHDGRNRKNSRQNGTEQ